MDERSRAHRGGNDSEPHLDWCRRSYELADGSTWQDPFDCQQDYVGPREEDFAAIEGLMMDGAPRFLVPYLYRALVDIAGEDWARHSLVWTLRLDDFARHATFSDEVPVSPACN